ncbi:Uma2 family endonuclease [Streptomyces albipurpureus]|uniref:Uma2 family endonuclease n=1 Tax=Streptomyces albipurpureus TaxID=2897419 RepID=A0ABT0UYD9_9ACTN|nr:Uma2 family endonuclease [Streptomyces sp. CWNU-1]MCM2393125.1 Uma2 family endonuclease [Streptomyces sp. CWNU-1]
MTIASDDRNRDVIRYQAVRDLVARTQGNVPGKLEITRGEVIHDRSSPEGLHELTAARVSRRLEKVMPEGLLAHTGTPDVEDVSQGVLRHPDIIVIAEADMEVEGSFDPRTGEGAVLSDVHPTPGGPRYATRKDFLYREEIAIGEWVISTENLPRYP